VDKFGDAREILGLNAAKGYGHIAFLLVLEDFIAVPFSFLYGIPN
jgi:hypothetical protein